MEETASGITEAAEHVNHVSTDVSWTASEYIAHNKNASWYMALLGVTTVLAALVFLATEDKISTGMILVVGLAFGGLASKQPRVLSYHVTPDGLGVGDKFYPFHDFKSFAIQEEGAIDSIFLVPIRRFMPGLTIYYPPDYEEQIITAIGDFLPHEEREPDTLDKIMRKVRF